MGSELLKIVEVSVELVVELVSVLEVELDIRVELGTVLGVGVLDGLEINEPELTAVEVGGVGGVGDINDDWAAVEVAGMVGVKLLGSDEVSVVRRVLVRDVAKDRSGEWIDKERRVELGGVAEGIGSVA